MFKDKLENHSKEELLIYLEKLIHTYLNLVRSDLFRNNMPKDLILLQVEKWLVQTNQLTIVLNLIRGLKNDQ